MTEAKDGEIATDLGTADLLKRIERHVSKVYPGEKSPRGAYLAWL